MPINPKFKALLKDPTIKFTIILGSGFHRQALGASSILSNWEKLLKDQDPFRRICNPARLYISYLISASLANL